MLSINHILLLMTISGYCACDLLPEVDTPSGKIRGLLKTSHGGRKFAAFEGIPFAKPPTGTRRFEEADPVEPWNGTIEATFPTQCAQTVMIHPKTIIGQEDCLHLNVYVPRENPSTEDNFDVIIHIHGGAFMYGSGHGYANPDYIIDKDVIFMTFNYRLNIFGFLSTEDEVIPGNNGLKDQVLALKWVQKNIASFGGNSSSITLTGLSAGGASVHLHYLSEMSEGLFHRGFSQSGCALNPWVIQEEPLTQAKILGKAVKCPTNDTLLLVECLKQKPYRELLEQIPLFFGYLFLPIAPFAPVVENGNGSKPFLSKKPYQLLAQGQVQDLPWLVSNVIGEGLLPAAFMKDDLDRVDTEWRSLAPLLMGYNYSLPESDWERAAKQIKEFYLGENKKFDNETFIKLVKIFTDRHFLVDSEDAIRLQANTTQSPIYYYQFSYSEDKKMVAHGKDRKYFFGNRKSLPPLSSNEEKMGKVLLDMLISFAQTDKPTIEGIIWEPVRADSLKYILIDGFDSENIKAQTRDELAPTSFWKSLNLVDN